MILMTESAIVAPRMALVERQQPSRVLNGIIR